ncbi:MAG: glycosyltransferase family 2 protein [Candidatus Thermoplasmatota archaeon]|nr:glycosyltransferase family 2 protein [Candidatus Thermoplasmatota archaeon]
MRVVVVMPARNEEELISQSIGSIPKNVDWIVVVDDGSTDNTRELSQDALGERGEVVSTKGLGVGGAIEVGSKHALTRFGKNCVVVVMAGDGQMDPVDLPAVIQPVVEGGADHVKGNRWMHPDGAKGMPFIRRLGTWWLSRLTSLASGVSIRDSQCGYTATSGAMIADWDWSQTWQGYGYPNWWLMEAGRRGFRIEEVAVKSIYADETSGIKITKFLSSVSWMLWKGVWRRGIDWYIVGKDTHPLLKLVATTLWFGGWVALLLSLQQPALLVAPPIAFIILASLDYKESKRRRGFVTA